MPVTSRLTVAPGGKSATSGDVMSGSGAGYRAIARGRGHADERADDRGLGVARRGREMRQDRRDGRTPGIRRLDDGTVPIGARLDVVADCPVAPDPNLDTRDRDLFGGPQRATADIAHLEVEPIAAGETGVATTSTIRRVPAPTLCATTVVARLASAAFGPGRGRRVRRVDRGRIDDRRESESSAIASMSQRTRHRPGWRHRPT